MRTDATWSMLVKPEAGWDEWATLLGRASSAGSGAQYGIIRFYQTNQISFYTGNDNHPYRGGNLPTGVWSVVTVTLSGGTVVGYIDKTEIFRFNNVPVLNSVPVELRFGAFSTYVRQNYRGEMKEALIYNRALAPYEVQQNCDVLKAGLP
ncbi:MAG: LamG-like jellyroll fold domain-containing protein [Bryobacteraceae bacterium]